VALIAFYGDESADMNDRVFALAGYVSTADEWDEFSKEWLSVIHNPRWPSLLSEFKAADCAARRNEFESWSQSACTDLVTRLVDVIVGPKYADMYGVGSAVMLEDLGRPDPSDPQSLKRIQGAYTMTGAVIFLNVAGRRLSRTHHDPIEFVFDSRPEVDAHIQRGEGVTRSVEIPKSKEQHPAW